MSSLENKSQKSEIQKRTIRLNIRLTPAEHEMLKNYAGGHRMASFIRDKCLNRNQSKYTKIRPIDPKLTQQLARIGNNLNQITKLLHTNINAKNPIEVLGLANQLQKIQSQLEKIKSGNMANDS